MIKIESHTDAAPIAIIERRINPDRRARHFLNFRRLFSKGRRGTLRRESDRRKIVLLDYYNPKIFYAVVLILLLSLLDALLTLWLLDMGAVEMNPVMAFFLNMGMNAFLIAKYLMTAISVVIIVVLNYVFLRYMKTSVGSLLKYAAISFAAVVVWELVLVVHIVS